MKKILAPLLCFCLALNDSKSLPVSQLQVTAVAGDFTPHSKTGRAPADTILPVVSCKDFTVTGKGDEPQWAKAKWNEMAKLDTGGISYESRFKVMYSATGIYVLFSGTDDKITTKDYSDFEAIYNGDVFEVFLHPDPARLVYFEYEVNQLNKQLILTLSRSNGQLTSWAPRFPSSIERQPIKKQVVVTGEKAAVGAGIKGWSAEMFFPYQILQLLPGIPPMAGTIWRANFCRLDYDSGNMIKYSWSPTIKRSFHELEQFRAIKFE